ncbi:unannotated protein [freshwater metagenome]|uniref:Unannotated protein n=1 Tax=freshwater metagenome TaxID=449393 RepID=A0A6J6GKC9_9ZZZZ
MAATRTWKNSSRLDEKMEQNLTRSSNGIPGSVAMRRTRSLKSSQLSSRLMMLRGRPLGVGSLTMRTVDTAESGSSGRFTENSPVSIDPLDGERDQRPLEAFSMSDSSKPRSHSTEMFSRSPSRMMRSRFRLN